MGGVLATDVDAELGLLTCAWSRIGQVARLSHQERSRARVLVLIPVSGVGVVVDDFSTGGNGVNSRTPRSDMVVDGMTYEKHTKDRSNTLSQCRCIG